MPVKDLDPNTATFGLAVFDDPEPPSSASPAAANPAPAKQDAGPFQTKDDSGITLISTSGPPAANENPLQLGQAQTPHTIIAPGFVPLSSSGEPGDTLVI